MVISIANFAFFAFAFDIPATLFILSSVFSNNVPNIPFAYTSTQ